MAPHNSVNVPGPIQNDSNIFQVFQNVQFNVVQHKKYIKELTKMYKKVNQDVFRNSFSNALHYLFTFGDTNPNVDRVIQFVAKFCTSLDDEEEFLLYIFGIIFNCQSVSGQSVRFRASQLLAAVLTALGDDASLDDDLCDKLLTSQLERLQDTRAGVRCRAAIALQRLQSPLEPDDLVTKAYRFHMGCDPSNSVRRAVVMSIAKCSRNLPYVLERLCDVDEGVRRAAFLYVSSVNVSQLKVRQRVHALKVGFNERSPRVRRVVEEILVPGWLGRFQGNIIELLTSIRLDNIEGAKESRVVAGKMLEALFKRLPVSELLEWLPTEPKLRLIPAEKLTKETAWYWRYLAHHLHTIEDSETLEMVLPDLVVFTGYIRAIVEAKCPDPVSEPVPFGTRMYVLEELASMLPVYDLADEVGRAALQQLLFDSLVGHNYAMTPDVLRAFVSAMELVLPDPTKRIEFVSSIISELRDPSDPDKTSEDLEAPTPVVESTEIKLQRARLRVSLNVALEAQEEAVQQQDYSLAAECKARVDAIHLQIDELNLAMKSAIKPVENKVEPVIREKRDDPETLNKCLIILNTLLDTPEIVTMMPLLKVIYQELEVEIFRNPAILENALQTVALFAMLDEQFCKEHQAFFFAHLMDRSNELIVTTALRCILDLLCVHGVSHFQESDCSNSEESESAANGSRRKGSTGGNRTALYDVSQGVDMGQDDDEDVIDKTMSQLSQSHGTVIELLLRFMDSECDKYRLIAVEGICRLLTLRNLVSPSILSRLFLIWFNPATEEEDLLRQTLGVFFQTFSCAVEGAQEQIQAAIYPTLKALAYAPVTSPLTEINFEEVIRFIVSLTRVPSSDETADLHGNLAVEICSQIMSSPMAPVVPLLCRTLSLLHPPRDLSLARELNRSIDVILKKIPEKTVCRHLTKYQANLEAFEINAAPKTTLDSIAEAVEEQSTDVELTLGLERLSTADSESMPVDEAIVSEDPENIIEETDSSPSSEQTQSSPPKRPRMTDSGAKSIISPRATRASTVSLPKEPEPSTEKLVPRSARAGSKNVAAASEVKGAKKTTRSGRNAESEETNSATPSTTKRDKRKSMEQIPPETVRKGSKATTNKVVPTPTRKSNRINVARSGLDSSQQSSQEIRLSQDSSGDDTTLHTVVYEKGKEVSVLNDSSDDEVSTRSKNHRTNRTVPETPETSDKSASSAEEEEPPKPRRMRSRK